MSDTHDMDCERALKNLEAFVDRELPESDQDRVEQHLRICRECCSRVEFESRLKERLSTLSSGDAPSKMRDRVRELIRRF
jgi:anti-sigma factor (TIGR02949 family)